MDELYSLYLEGIANEVMHLIQQYRREMKLDLLDYIDVALVELPFQGPIKGKNGATRVVPAYPTKLTSAIYSNVDAIVARCRIKQFVLKPLEAEGTRLWKGIKVDDAFGNSYAFDIYIKKHTDATPI